MPKLTKTFVEGVELPASGYKIHWDDRVPGYGLKVTATGVRPLLLKGEPRGRW